jgi:hypothetical protein
MKHFTLALFVCVTLGLTGSTYAKETFVSIKIGPTWPHDELNSDHPTAWDGELLYGIFIDRKVGFGISADFLWNTNTVVKDSLGKSWAAREEGTYMFPVMGFIVFDPIPNAVVHPMMRFEIGYNSLLYYLKIRDAVTTQTPTSNNGYYNGLIVKIGIDGLYNLGEQTAIFAGLEYQWANTSTNQNAEGFFSQLDMSGVGIRMGFRFLL